MKARTWVEIGCAGTLAAVLAGCGGGGGGRDGGGGGNNPPPPTFTVGGTLSGSTGSVVLQNNGAGNLTVAANGTFTFTGPLNSGAAYSVTVLTPAALQACSVANGSGTGSANVANVAITCADAPPTLALTLQKTKLFRFAWNSIAGSTHYRLLEDPTGSSDPTQLGADIPASTTSIEQVTTLYSRFRARYIVQACDAARCIDSNTVNVTGSLAEAIGYFKASNPHLGARFGTAVALSRDGTTLAVGAPGERSLARVIDGDQTDMGTIGERAGAVYVFTRTGNVWAQQAYVKAFNTDADDRFGTSVALSADGSVLAVGAELEDSNATNPFDDLLPDSGAVYVFGRAEATWTQQEFIKASNAGDGDAFGHSLVLSDDGRTLAVSATGEDSGTRVINGDGANDSELESGAVYVFVRAADEWDQQAYVKASNSEEGDVFGDSLALSRDGGTLAVGAPREDSGARNANGNQAINSTSDSGAVYVYGRLGIVWSHHAYLKASNTNVDDRFGSAVALSEDGSTLAVGAIGEAGSGAGAGEDDNSTDESGAVYVFARSPNNVWTARQAYLKASTAGRGDRFGSSVTLSADGQTLLVGAARERSIAQGIGGDETDNSGNAVGAAYAFTRSGASWSQQAYIKASNAGVSASQEFGQVALSGDATVLAVGAREEDNILSGINVDENDVSLSSAGAVYLY